MSGFFWGIIGTIVGTVVGFLVKEAVEFIKSIKGKYSGEWWQIIYDDKGKIVKKDLVKCQHIGNTLRGNIQRIEPTDQSYKKWKFEGQVRETLFFGIFWTTDEIKNPNSYGTLQLNIVNPNKMEGFYVKHETDLRGYRFTRSLKSINFKWERKIQ